MASQRSAKPMARKPKKIQPPRIHNVVGFDPHQKPVHLPAEQRASESGFLDSAADLIKTLNKEGFTEIFLPRPLTADDSLLLGHGCWTKVEEHSELLRVGPNLIAFLRNPLTKDESAISTNGSASGWGEGGYWTQTSSKHNRVYRGDSKNVWQELHNDVDSDIKIEEQLVGADKVSDPAQFHAPLAHNPVLPDTRRPQKSSYGGKMVEDDRIITKKGVRYFPLSLAAQVAQAPRQTLLNWIKNKTKFEGRPLQSYNSPTAKKFYVSEESVQRMAKRFVKWPSNKPAGRVTIGETDDQTGFLGLPDAARILGVSPRTMWLWASQGKAPTHEPPDIIKCTTSDHFYIRESDVSALRTLVPRSGLPRGRRTQLAPRP